MNSRRAVHSMTGTSFEGSGPQRSWCVAPYYHEANLIVAAYPAVVDSCLTSTIATAEAEPTAVGTIDLVACIECSRRGRRTALRNGWRSAIGARIRGTRRYECRNWLPSIQQQTNSLLLPGFSWSVQIHLFEADEMNIRSTCCLRNKAFREPRR